MAKRKQKHAPAFKLTRKASDHLNKNLAAIREGIVNVCKMHTHDSNGSLTQEDFELLYIDKVLGQPITAISATIRTLAEQLTKQKEAALEQLTGNKINTEDTQK